MKHIGIDYGSKYSGTTAICYVKKKALHFDQSERQKDADEFVDKWLTKNKPEAIYIDAPLSLPAAYHGTGTDFFFRKCDIELDSKSPMSIGRLTATAMQLKAKFSSDTTSFYETYPGALAKALSEAADKTYSQKQENFEPFIALLEEHLPIPFAKPPEDWHQVEAALAWLAGHRHINDKAEMAGEAKEGIILY